MPVRTMAIRSSDRARPAWWAARGASIIPDFGPRIERVEQRAPARPRKPGQRFPFAGGARRAARERVRAAPRDHGSPARRGVACGRARRRSGVRGRREDALPRRPGVPVQGGALLQGLGAPHAGGGLVPAARTGPAAAARLQTARGLLARAAERSERLLDVAL